MLLFLCPHVSQTINAHTPDVQIHFKDTDYSHSLGDNLLFHHLVVALAGQSRLQFAD
ncbi:MAG: hypothetical protein IJ270_02520 [Paludibacteraceae bacterium]|nr:hypothetical protein [Paludibacteraceae bacterium]